MPVNTRHPEYTRFLPRWTKCRRLMDSDAHQYIEDIEVGNPTRSEKYRSDAILTNFTARTVNGLVGLVFTKDPKFKLPPQIEYMEFDCTDDNLSLVHAAKETFEETLVTGRRGVMADYPAINGGANARDLELLNLKARLYLYDAEEIINWAESIVNGQKMLTMVHLYQCYDKLGADGFQWVKGERYINLRLIDGIFVQREYDESMRQVGDVSIPRKGNNQPFTELPFSFVGSRKNKPAPDSPPMYDIACINIGHLKNSAAYEESIVVCGQPSLFITTSMNQKEFEVANPGGIKIGARKGHNLGESGSAFMLQADPNSLAADGMKTKEHQAFMLGAQLLQPQASNETAAAARIRNASELSVVDSVATNVSEAFRKGLKWCAEYMGANPDIVEFDLNYDYINEIENPQSTMAQIQLLDRKAIAMSDIRVNLKKVGLLEESRKDEDIDAEIEMTNPIVGAVDAAA